MTQEKEFAQIKMQHHASQTHDKELCRIRYAIGYFRAEAHAGQVECDQVVIVGLSKKRS